MAEQIEGVPLLTLLDRKKPSGSVFTPVRCGTIPRPMIRRERWSRSASSVHPDVEKDDVLNARRRSVVDSVQAIVADERAGGDWGQGVDFHVASAIVMMMELEKRPPGGLHVSSGFDRRGHAELVSQLSYLANPGRGRARYALAILLTLGWLGAGGGTLGVVTVATPALISIIGVASTMHFGEYAAEYGSTGESRFRPRLISWVAVPCLGAAATTAVGFLMLVFNDLEPVRDLGVQLFVGSLLAFFGVFLISQVIPIRNASGGVLLTHDRFRRDATTVTRWPIRTTLALLAVTLLLLFCAWPRPADRPIGLYVDADPFSFFNKDQPIARALDLFSQRKFGVYQLDVVLVPKEFAAPPKGGRAADPVYTANRLRAREYSDLILSRRSRRAARRLDGCLPSASAGVSTRARPRAQGRGVAGLPGQADPDHVAIVHLRLDLSKLESR